MSDSKTHRAYALAVIDHSINYSMEVKKIYFEMLALQKKVTQLSLQVAKDTEWPIQGVDNSHQLLNISSNLALSEVLSASLLKEQEIYKNIAAVIRSEEVFGNLKDEIEDEIDLVSHKVRPGGENNSN
jgi:hypothetical protein